MGCGASTVELVKAGNQQILTSKLSWTKRIQVQSIRVEPYFGLASVDAEQLRIVYNMVSDVFTGGLTPLAKGWAGLTITHNGIRKEILHTSPTQESEAVVICLWSPLGGNLEMNVGALQRTVPVECGDVVKIIGTEIKLTHVSSVAGDAGFVIILCTV